MYVVGVGGIAIIPANQYSPNSDRQLSLFAPWPVTVIGAGTTDRGGTIRCGNAHTLEQILPSPRNSQASGLQRKRHLDLLDRGCNYVKWSALPRPSCWNGTRLPEGLHPH